ncbi:winged helix-turn-helix domain-containing protein [Nocardia sp. 2]|uniref:Winged helix-turn-helix domain-containing protein n=1 Tax=Nocardia acididurans TaxID=2802282 RepID=A0ABS1M706_9NOCA|nr:BTAD domain-containing putative transcriptional regulator [Nocardia acididurans]MBL1076432.1 winged helix-turn-helix domain-containing protein [Nocardia acididurans]
MIEFKLLGSVDLVVDGRTVDVGPAKQRGILAALLVEPDRPISMDVLVDRVWDAPPESARNSIYTYMTRLRRILRTATAHFETPVDIHRDHGGYRVLAPVGAVDLAGFRELVGRARALRADDPVRSRLLTQALGMWRGEPLAGVDSDWARRFRDSLAPLRHEAITEWADAELRQGHHKLVADGIREALVESPLAEDLHERLLEAYHLDNRGAQALSHYDRMRRTFASELGVDPSPRLRALHGRLLGGQSAPETAPVVPISSRRRSDALVRETSPAHTWFRGRAADIERVRHALSEDTGHGIRPVLITGGPGIGKSALASRVAELTYDRFPGGVVQVSLGGCTATPVDPIVVLERLLRDLGEPVPADPAARGERFRAAVARRRMLVVLDDAASDAQIAPLLTSDPNGATLITSRIAVGTTSVRRVVLRELPMSESVEVFEAVLGADRVRAEEWATSALARCCSGIPLALQAVAARLAARPRWTITQQLARLSDEDRRLREYSYGTLDISHSIDVSVDRLTPCATAVLRHLGATLSPRELFTTVTLPGLANGAGADALDELVDAHLLSVVRYADGTRPDYTMLEIHRLYAKRLSRRDAVADPAEALLA